MKAPDEILANFIRRNPFFGTLTFGFGIAAEIALIISVIAHAASRP